MKILLLTKNVNGGNGSFVFSLLKISKKYKFRFCVLEKPFFRKIFVDNFIFFSNPGLYTKRPKITISYFYQIIKELLWFKSQIKQFNPDIILSIDSHSIILAQILLFITRMKITHIASIHNNIKVVFDNNSSFILCFYRYFMRWSLVCANKVVCVSAGLATHIKTFFFLNTLPSVINYGLLNKERVFSREFSKNKPKIILSVARLSNQKDHITLLKAFSLVLKKIPHCRLWLVGDGPLRSCLKNHVVKLKIRKHVRFMGWKENLSFFYKNADIFVLSSKNEGFGRVLIEAMQYSLPIISTGCPFGPEEILANGKYGYLTKIESSKDLYKKIFLLLTDGRKYEHFSKMALLRVKNYELSIMFKKYIELFRN